MKSSRAGSGSGISRRTLGRGLLAAGGLYFTGAVIDPFRLSARADSRQGLEVDYIVVGAGAGGGPVAARLAEAGYTVALIEAGVNPDGDEARAVDPSTGIIYHVPALAAVSEPAGAARPRPRPVRLRARWSSAAPPRVAATVATCMVAPRAAVRPSRSRVIRSRSVREAATRSRSASPPSPASWPR